MFPEKFYFTAEPEKMYELFSNLVNCEEAEEEERRRSILKHIKINLDEPGLCNACGKNCATLESLTRHIRKAGHVLCPFCTVLLPYDTSPSHIFKGQGLTSE